ncbi:hypothetical protein HY496_01400 [Candidatus Woesearchaeota archaeon]|nr:hypothetical protein [Candidatus Woesearchaeota archaeon]
MKLSKKAIAAGFLVLLVIALVSFFLLAGTYIKFSEKGEEKQKAALCKDSVRLRAATAVNLAGQEIKYSPLLCQTIDKKVSGSPEEVQKAIADSMATCWQMFGEGQYKKNIFDSISTFGGDARCFLCYTVAVDPSTKFKVNTIRNLDFMQYLSTTPYRTYGEGASKREEKYIQYIQSGAGRGYFYGFLTEEGIKPGRAYGVMYKAKHADIGAGGAAIGAVGAGTALASFFTGNVVGLFGGAYLAGSALISAVDTMLQNPTNIDGIFLVDISDPDLRQAFLGGDAHCSYVSDAAGG